MSDWQGPRTTLTAVAVFGHMYSKTKTVPMVGEPETRRFGSSQRQVSLDRKPGMADFALVRAAVDHVLGTMSLATNRGLGQELATEAVTSEPVPIAITGTIREEVVDTSAGILTMLEADWPPMTQMPTGWPRTARELTAMLRRHAARLRQMGWTCEDLGAGGGKAKAVPFVSLPPYYSMPTHPGC